MRNRFLNILSCWPSALFTQRLPLRSPSFQAPNDGPFQLSKQEKSDTARKTWQNPKSFECTLLERGWPRPGFTPILGGLLGAHGSLGPYLISAWWTFMGDHRPDTATENPGNTHDVKPVCVWSWDSPSSSFFKLTSRTKRRNLACW